MSSIIGDTACPRCVENGGDKTHNHLMLFENGGAYCNRCGYKDNWKDSDIEFKERKEISEEELKDLLEDFQSCPIEPWPKRKLKKPTLERYGCRTGVSPADRSTGAYLMPLYEADQHDRYTLTGFKVRLAEEKKFWCQGKVKDACFFGEHLLPTGNFKKLFVCEAPIDALSVYQAIKDSWRGTKWESVEPNVVALPHGTGCAVDVFDKRQRVVDRAEEVILIFDNDEAGKEAVDEVRKLRPDVKTVQLPAKDPNEMLQDNESNRLAKLCMFGYESVTIAGLYDISDCYEEIVKQPQWGLSYPWGTLTRLTYGIRKEIIGFAGGVGIGKSEFKYQIVEHLVDEEGEVVAVFDLEATRGRTGKAIVGKKIHQMLHKPDVEYDEEEVKAAVEQMKGKVKLYDHKGIKDWDNSIKPAIRHAVVVDGAGVVMLDPLTALVSHLSSSEANDELNRIMGELASMTSELGFALIYFAHLNPPKHGQPHERGGKVNEFQLTGSRAMIKWSHYIIGLERNKDPDLPEYERNTTTVVLLKDREFGNVGKFKVYYDNKTGDLRELF